MDPIEDCIGIAIDAAIESEHLPISVRSSLTAYQDLTAWHIVPYSVKASYLSRNLSPSEVSLAQRGLGSLRDKLVVLEDTIVREMISDAAHDGPYMQEEWDHLVRGYHMQVSLVFDPVIYSVDGYIAGFGARSVLDEISAILGIGGSGLLGIGGSTQNSLDAAVSTGWAPQASDGSGGGGSSSDRHDTDATDNTLPGGTPEASDPSVPLPPDTTAPTGGEVWVDPNTGRTNIQGDANHTGHATQAPLILDLDGDGVEVNASAQVSFDWDGFRERGRWAVRSRAAKPGGRKRRYLCHLSGIFLAAP